MTILLYSFKSKIDELIRNRSSQNAFKTEKYKFHLKTMIYINIFLSFFLFFISLQVRKCNFPGIENVIK